jgi:hypothetical protein
MGSISVFDENVQMGLDDGLPLYMARQRAIDYHRRYTARELVLNDGYLAEGADVTPDAAVLGEGNWLDANLSSESRMSFNEQFGLMLEHAQEVDSGIGIKWLCRLARNGNLEHILDDELQAIVEKELGEAKIDFIADLAELCGYEIRKGRRVPAEFQFKLDEFLTGLREFAKTSTQDWYERKGV